jgi:uncharacterized protein (DUF2141 family)
MMFRTATYGLVLGVLSIPCSGASADEGPPKHALVAHVTGLKSNDGQLGCMLFKSADGFPAEPKKAVARVWTPIVGNSGTCSFVVPPGSYAILAMHDANGNGLMDRSFLGIPKEGFGASRGAHGAFGPKFADARFDYAGGTQDTAITIHY